MSNLDTCSTYPVITVPKCSLLRTQISLIVPIVEDLTSSNTPTDHVLCAKAPARISTQFVWAFKASWPIRDSGKTHSPIASAGASDILLQIP